MFTSLMPLTLTPAERRELEALDRATSRGAGLVQRAPDSAGIGAPSAGDRQRT
jgi:hypothetical protein